LVRTWTGQIQPEGREEHERFVAWLASAEGGTALGRALLSSYRLRELDGRLTVEFGAEEPPPIIRFLRNRRFWPQIWQFESADPTAAVPAEAVERVNWRA
jgi:hypothetical protein